MKATVLGGPLDGLEVEPWDESELDSTLSASRVEELPECLSWQRSETSQLHLYYRKAELCVGEDGDEKTRYVYVHELG